MGLGAFLLGLLITAAPELLGVGNTAIDPGVNLNAPPRAGGPLPGLSPQELTLFNASLKAFTETDSVKGTFVSPNFGAETGSGLGPRFNANSCAACHIQPAIGGTSPIINPQFTIASDAGATNVIPSFITKNGPIREARFPLVVDANGQIVKPPMRDGGVHALFTITGRADAPGCNIGQPPFDVVQAQNNLSFRIPTPVFGAGLIEAIADSTILNSHASTQTARLPMAIAGRENRGRENRTGNDSTITRFGWKAQNKSLLIFAGEAYNVEIGVTNELFQNERDTEPTPLPASCIFNGIPEDHTNFDQLNQQGATFADVASDIVKFEIFMRFSAPPAPSCDSFAGKCPFNIQRGRALFDQIGCALCHTPQLAVSQSSSDAITKQSTAQLFSDLLIHHMGEQLADGVTQGLAGDDEFRTAPLWGVGQRIFFLHDGRTSNLIEAIEQHASPGSEANRVIHYYNLLSAQQQQFIIDFLRSL
ncbi:MAG TPA: di-heme oxidoredictase family protein [Burkholderiales bacterium]|nr:di-heme oxidoredictase family protein [Burkholderiales bacterium]